MSTDDMSPLQTYIAARGHGPEGRTAELLMEAERGWNRARNDQNDKAGLDDDFETSSAESETARAEFLTNCRPAQPEDLKAWLVGFKRRGGEVRYRREGKMRGSFHVLERCPAEVPSLYGAFSLSVIVPEGLMAPDDLPRTFHGQCGHSTFYFMDGFEIVGDAESFADAR